MCVCVFASVCACVCVGFACVICVCLMYVCVVVVVWVPFCENVDGVVAGLFCECVVFLSLGCCWLVL